MAKRKVSEVNGIFIHHEDNKHIYWDIFTQKGYSLINDDVPKLMLDKFSLPIAAILAYVLIQFKVEAKTSLLIGAGVYVVAKILWRVLFLYKCPTAKSVNKGSLGEKTIELINKYNRPRLIILVFLTVCLIGVMLYSLLTYKLEIVYQYILIGGIVVASILMILGIVAIIYKSKK